VKELKLASMVDWRSLLKEKDLHMERELEDKKNTIDILFCVFLFLSFLYLFVLCFLFP
jgi:hypothetical protein